MARVEEKFNKTSTLPVTRGLYVLKYIESLDPVSPAIAEVGPAKGDEGSVTVVSAPGVDLGVLSRPGAAAVLRVERDATIIIGIRKGVGGSSVEASLRLELLAQGEVEARIEALPPQDVAALHLVAHVSMRGDVEVGEGDWIAGPKAPAPIEGLELRGAPTGGGSLEVQVLLSTRPPRWSSWCGRGEYAGTRGKSLPLSGVRLRLSGGATNGFEILAEAAFLGSSLKTQRGREVELVSNAGGDPLVGLKINVVAATQIGESQGNAGAGAERRPRVQVFRAASRN